MHKLWIIIQREFAVKVKKKSFIILTILMPFLIAGLIFVPAFLAQMNSTRPNRVGIIDQQHLLPDTLMRDTAQISFVRLYTGQGATLSKSHLKHFISKNLSDDALTTYDAIMVVSDSITSANSVTLYSTSEVPQEVETYVDKRLTEALRDHKLRNYHVKDINRLIEDANAEYTVRTVRLDNAGNETMSSAEIAGFIGMILSLFIYMFILSYGGMVMSSVVEEKANRIVEVMVSSIKPWQLMAGKMIGTALVGLFQFLIWGLMITSLFMIATGLLGISQSPATAMPSGMDAGQIQSIVGQDSGLEFLQVLQGMPIAEIIVLFVLYFIGGYLLFASIFSAIGASVNEQEDTQQFMMPVILIFIFALYAGMFSMQNPDGPLAIWCSYIPFTSPIVMMVRIPFQIPLWQIALSLLILYGSAIAILLLSSKIYRVGILMYGKKPTFRDMIRWLRFK